jgi:hypothetical protein
MNGYHRAGKMTVKANRCAEATAARAGVTSLDRRISPDSFVFNPEERSSIDLSYKANRGDFQRA